MTDEEQCEEQGSFRGNVGRKDPVLHWVSIFRAGSESRDPDPEVLGGNMTKETFGSSPSRAKHLSRVTVSRIKPQISAYKSGELYAFLTFKHSIVQLDKTSFVWLKRMAWHPKSPKIKYVLFYIATICFLQFVYEKVGLKVDERLFINFDCFIILTLSNIFIIIIGFLKAFMQIVLFKRGLFHINSTLLSLHKISVWIPSNPQLH